MILTGSLFHDGADHAEAAGVIGKTVAVHESMPFAVYCFLKHHGSFEECLLCAVTNGGDRDTLGAMACAISGAFHGFEKLPSSWTGLLENREYIAGLAEGLAARCFKARFSRP
ncbi:MAG: ADP-ribosylglycohydrolase family protein [Deltaproteobacteria bacterium]|nr:ADP-ribosylglycohydrolase family protein [Deltaproteobacteria bacterium]